MKRSLRSALYITSAVVLSGGLVYLVSPKAPVALQQEVQTIAAPVVEQAKEVLAPVEAAVASVASNVVEWAQGAPAQQAGVPMVLLSEPVIILGADQGREALPKGTPVRVIKHHGFYVQVQHEARVITIPRTAMTLGAYRMN